MKQLTLFDPQKNVSFRECPIHTSSSRIFCYFFDWLFLCIFLFLLNFKTKVLSRLLLCPWLSFSACWIHMGILQCLWLYWKYWAEFQTRLKIGLKMAEKRQWLDLGLQFLFRLGMRFMVICTKIDLFFYFVVLFGGEFFRSWFKGLGTEVSIVEMHSLGLCK